MKISKKAMVCLLSCSMAFYTNIPVYHTAAKSTAVKKNAYTISKKPGTYENSVKLKLKVKKGYTVYYTTGSRLYISKKVKSASSKTFTFKKTSTLKIYAVKSSKKMTASKLKKIKSSAMSKYKYIIVKKNASQNSSTPAATSAVESESKTAVTTNAPTTTPTEETSATATPLPSPSSPAIENPTATPDNKEATSSPTPTISPTADAKNSIEPSSTPDTSVALPTRSPSISQTAAPVSTPSGSKYTGDDSSSDYVAPSRTVYDTDDTDTSVDNATEITLLSSAPDSKVTASNYEISKKNKLTITAPGTYIIRSNDNETTDGLIEVKYADDTVSGTVHLILDGVRLTSTANTSPDSDTGLITIKNNVTKAVITIADNNTNTLTDTGKTGIDSDDNSSVTYTAGIVSKKVPLTINGSGTLNIISTYGNGIKCTNDLKILNCVLNVSGPDSTAVGHNGITGKTGLTLNNATINVHSDNDALKTTLDETDIAAATGSSISELGNIEIDNGNYTVVSENGDGVSAYRTFYLNPSAMTVTTKNAAASTEDSSYKGIKAGTTIYVPETAGKINVDTTATYNSSRASGDSNDPLADDTIHCNGYIKIDGGTFTLASGDDGIHSDTGLVVNNGTILITESYEGLESGDITINGGDIDITSRDDGLNAAGGNKSSDTSTSQGPGDAFNKGDSSSSTAYQIIINGGTITIDAEGDGIDSNGNIFFKGGTVTVNGPTNGGNGALDYGDSSDCVCEISGGTLIAAGASGMDVSTTSGSSQPAVNVRFTSEQSANTYVVVKNSSGNTVLTARPTKSFQSVVLSCSDFTLGSTYIIYYGSDLNNLTSFDTVTFSSVSMTVGSTSGQGPDNNGGNNNPGGGPGNNRPGRS